MQPKGAADAPERTHGVAELLADVPLFVDVDPVMLPRIVATATVVRLSAGEVLFREGVPGDSLFVVVAGRLEVTRSNGTGETFLATLGRGAMVGETALLTGGARTATVRAVRDCELVSVARGGFAELLADPPFARELTRAPAQRLAAHATPTQPMGRRVAVVAVGSLDDGIATRPAADALRAAWPRPERVAVLDEAALGEAAVGEPGAGTWAERVERAERDCELVVLVTDTSPAASPAASGEGAGVDPVRAAPADRALVLTRPGAPAVWKGRADLREGGSCTGWWARAQVRTCAPTTEPVHGRPRSSPSGGGSRSC